MQEAAPSSPTGPYRGLVRRFNRHRGFGWIWPSDARLDDLTKLVFVHFRDVEGQDYLRPGELVVFDLEARTDQPRQWRAVRVRRVRPGGKQTRGMAAVASTIAELGD
jgi:cold shock CspA family protein